MTLPAPLPPSFVDRVLGTSPIDGPAWLEALPIMVDSLARRWGLSQLEAPFPLSYGYVCAALRGRAPVVLKLAVDRDVTAREAATLRAHEDHGAVLVLEHHDALGAILLERCQPGESLEQLALKDDVRATGEAATVLREWQVATPSPPGFPHIRDWARAFERLRARFDGGTGPLPASLFGRAESLLAALLASSGPGILLHGDLHHGNILASGRRPWLVIDPKGAVGEAEYEVGALLRNPTPALAADRTVAARRLAQLSEELGFDRARLRDWAIAQAVLSATWSIEDNADPAAAIAIAETFAAI